MRGSKKITWINTSISSSSYTDPIIVTWQPNIYLEAIMMRSLGICSRPNRYSYSAYSNLIYFCSLNHMALSLISKLVILLILIISFPHHMEDDVLYKQDCSFLRNSDANLMVAKVVASLFV